jgi:Flp pilus assembly protein TadD
MTERVNPLLRQQWGVNRRIIDTLICADILKGLLTGVLASWRQHIFPRRLPPMPKATLRIASPLVALLLGCTALCGSAQAGWFSDDAPSVSTKTDAAKAAPATDLDGSIRQAQLLRLAGNYAEAIHQLSQIMLVASDDPRVVSEYGKTLAAMGRASEAVSFLTRARQLQPGDWTVYSALGVAYDQLDNQASAREAYEHALALKPGEPSVLNNYALSRMLAKDPQTAKLLIARAEIAGGASDPKIARNIAMIRQLAPDAPAQGTAVNNPTPSPTPRVGMAAMAPVRQMAQNPSAPTPFATLPVAPVSSGAPRPLMAPNTGFVPQRQAMMAAPITPMAMPRDNRVVMQRVPVDPLAGPVAVKPEHVAANRAPRALPHGEKSSLAKADAPLPMMPLPPAPAEANTQAAPRTAANQANDLEAKAEAIAKQLAAKPGAIAAAKKEANAAPAPARPVSDKQGAPHVLAPQPVKAAAAKPADTKQATAKAVPVKAAAKDAIPGLRMSANAY